jgi:hypothetical protein
MWALAGEPIMLDMIRPNSSSKVLLVADRREQQVDSAAAPVRRFRLARVRLQPRSTEPAARYEHLKQVYD